MADLAGLMREAELHCNAGRHALAEQMVREVLRERPGEPAATFLLARAIHGQDRLLEAAGVARELLDRFPGHPAVAALRYNVMMQLGDADEAMRDLVAAVKFVPDHLDLLSNLAGVATWAAGPSAEDVYRMHRDYGLAVERARRGRGLETISNPDPDRKLRIGVVAGDYRLRSSVSFFLKPVFEHLDRREFEVIGYHTAAAVDEGIEVFRGLAAAWRHLPDPDPDVLARRIVEDRIDVALEVNQHTGMRRTMPAFWPRCAPVQVAYMAYANTTGIRSFDWRIVDSLTDPPGSEVLATEKLWRLDPCFIAYEPSPLTPGAGPAPCLSRGHVCFGAFSEPLKLNEMMFGMWARILHGVPGSRLLLKNRAVAHADSLRHLRGRLERAGVDLMRVDFAPWVGVFREHLATYGHVDISLDTIPYNGTTTVCEALVMGVPVITAQPGPRHHRHAARVATSLLTNAGLGELVARDEEDYVRLAMALAQDRARLAALRADIPARFRASPICDGAGYARRLGAALREMWRMRVAEGIR